MILGIGTDIVNVKRLEKGEAFLNRFIRRCLTEEEQQQMIRRSLDDMPAMVLYLAKRFAAKEAVSKALGTGIKGFSLTEIEIREDDNGKPYFVLSGRAAKLAEGLSLHLSMSHEREEAVAMVVAEYEK